MNPKHWRRKPPRPCRHKWILGMQDFTGYPKCKAHYICNKCGAGKWEIYGGEDDPKT